MENLFGLGLTVFLLFFAFVSGKIVENRRLNYLDRKEKEFAGITHVNLKNLPEGIEVANAHLVTGTVVVANNYFKAFLSSWVNLFGGEMRSYQRLIEQGRRLAVVRMLEEANQLGANKVWNIRLQTSTAQSGNNKKMAGVELIAYGTAIVGK